MWSQSDVFAPGQFALREFAPGQLAPGHSATRQFAPGPSQSDVVTKVMWSNSDVVTM